MCGQSQCFIISHLKSAASVVILMSFPLSYMSSLDQCAKKVVSDSQWPVDFVIGLVDSDPVVLGIQFSESLKTNVFFLTSS